jgi:hypothetical protein
MLGTDTAVMPGMNDGAIASLRIVETGVSKRIPKTGKPAVESVILVIQDNKNYGQQSRSQYAIQNSSPPNSAWI